MLAKLDGSTRISVIIGTPIVQVRSPEGITRELQRRGLNALLVPLELAAKDVPALVDALALSPSIDGIIVTVPHKEIAATCCQALTPRAQFLGAVNVMRRTPTGGFLGDHVDGESLRLALADAGVELAGARALLIGCGGAGAAIGLAVLEAGVAALALADTQGQRSEALRSKLARRFPDREIATASDASTAKRAHIVINASPVGMRPDDPSPIDVSWLRPDMAVADATTPPGDSALIIAARRLGCRTVDGRTMFSAGIGLLTDALVGSPKD